MHGVDCDPACRCAPNQASGRGGTTSAVLPTPVLMQRINGNDLAEAVAEWDHRLIGRLVWHAWRLRNEPNPRSLIRAMRRELSKSRRDRLRDIRSAIMRGHERKPIRGPLRRIPPTQFGMSRYRS